MAFYEDISYYYDYIFPTGKEQLDFICQTAGNPPKSLLDIACGTGGYSIELSRKGYAVTATDIDAAMIEALKSKLSEQDGNAVCIKAGMLELEEKLKARFDLAFCIGNSMFHLEGSEEIQAFLKSAKGLLKKDGKLVIQIINFDRVLAKGIKQLPVIKDDKIGLSFERYYKLDRDINRIFFRTILKVDDNIIENEIPLYPLESGEIIGMLEKAGFNNIKTYGDFKGSRFDMHESYMLVLLAS